MRIGVAGCGIAGTTAAIRLARDGHRVSLIERAETLGPVGAGILLQPSGQRILRGLGLLETVAARAEPIERLCAFTAGGRVLVDLPYAELGAGLRAYGVARGRLFAPLLEACRAAGVEILTGQPVESFSGGPGEVRLRVTGGGELGPFDFVLASDGSRSALREASSRRGWQHEYRWGALWAVGPCAAVRGRLLQRVRGTRQLGGLLPMGDGRCSLFWSLRRDALDALHRRGFEAWRDDVLAMMPEAEELLARQSDFENVPHTVYRHVMMRSWRDGGVAFLGDAAHAMSPHLGQGANLALEDGAAFADALAETGDFVPACGLLRRRRKRRIALYAWLTLALTPFFQSGGLVKGWGRDVALPAMRSVPWLRRRMIAAMCGFGLDVRAARGVGDA